MTLQRVIKKLRDDNKIVPVSVTDAEVQAEYQRTKDYLPKKPAAVTFKQIIIAPQPSEAAKTVARVRAESLLAELQHGADFEKLAKRESMDPVTKETGGDLGWMRRGNQFPEFDRWLFGASFLAPLAPGQISPVFETPYGFHIVRVDRVQPGEVRARQILIVPKIDSTDIAKTAKLADSVAKMWKAGVPFDTLAKKYHDFAGQEETSILTPFPRDSLPMPYQLALAGKSVGDFAVFRIPGSSVRPEVPKFVVAQLLSVDEGGNQTLGELKEAIRSDLAQRGGTRRYVDGLRKQTFVSVRLDAPSSVAAKPKSAP
jgi:peptidyl-prolyl cis-trans isomerase SurA